ncbi:MAG: hypothetical protein EOO78_29655, partial [Oxalobacteraceae bacterium]
PTAADHLGAWVVDRAVRGVGPLCGAAQLVHGYRADRNYPHDEARLEALCRREVGKSFTAGFVTGLAGMLTLPVGLCSNLGTLWILQARLAAAIATLRGHDLRDAWVRSLVFSCLLGSAAPDVLRRSGVQLAQWVTRRAVLQLGDAGLGSLNRRIGVRLLATGGGRGALSLTRLVPVAGAAVGGLFDAATARATARCAKGLFAPPRLLSARQA